jgi:hypothetical protein
LPPLDTDAMPLGNPFAAEPRQKTCLGRPIMRRTAHRRHGSTPSGAGKWSARRKPPRGVLLASRPADTRHTPVPCVRPAWDASRQRSLGMPKLLVRSTLPTLIEAVRFKRGQNSTYCARGRRIAQRAERGATPLRPMRGKDHSDAVVSPSRSLIRGSRRSQGPRPRALDRASCRSSSSAGIRLQRANGGAVWRAARAQCRLARTQPVRRGPGDKVEAHSNQNSAREFACPRLTPMPCRWATRLRRSRDRKIAWAVQSCAAQRTGAMAPRRVARESGARGENHRVVFSSHPGWRRKVTCP